MTIIHYWMIGLCAVAMFMFAADYLFTDGGWKKVCRLVKKFYGVR